jgi:hypothetical protein
MKTTAWVETIKEIFAVNPVIKVLALKADEMNAPAPRWRTRIQVWQIANREIWAVVMQVAPI